MLRGHTGNLGGAVSSRRNKFEIVADILRLGKASRTGIVCSSNLKVGQLDKYLRWLCDQGYLTVTHANKKTIYCTTEQGRKLMELIDELVGMLAGQEALTSVKASQFERVTMAKSGRKGSGLAGG